MKTRIYIRKAKDGWRWRAKRAGKIVAESGEAYTRRNNLLKSLLALFTNDYEIIK